MHKGTAGAAAFKVKITELFKSVEGRNTKAFEGMKEFQKSWTDADSPEKMLTLLRSMQTYARNNKDIMPFFNNIIDSLKDSFNKVNYNDQDFSKEQKDALDMLVKGLERVANAKDNS